MKFTIDKQSMAASLEMWRLGYVRLEGRGGDRGEEVNKSNWINLFNNYINFVSI